MVKPALRRWTSGVGVPSSNPSRTMSFVKTKCIREHLFTNALKCSPRTPTGALPCGTGRGPSPAHQRPVYIPIAWAPPQPISSEYSVANQLLRCSIYFLSNYKSIDTATAENKKALLCPSVRPCGANVRLSVRPSVRAVPMFVCPSVRPQPT